mmetsp:Transcript_25204/g.54629  ORF Transcript_25204/g.54629 Transcript_25204/m.54629 type:complete len:347 (+) Transcript_25204:726-1766(+)
MPQRPLHHISRLSTAHKYARRLGHVRESRPGYLVKRDVVPWWMRRVAKQRRGCRRKAKRTVVEKLLTLDSAKLQHLIQRGAPCSTSILVNFGRCRLLEPLHLVGKLVILVIVEITRFAIDVGGVGGDGNGTRGEHRDIKIATGFGCGLVEGHRHHHSPTTLQCEHLGLFESHFAGGNERHTLGQHHIFCQSCPSGFHSLRGDNDETDGVVIAIPIGLLTTISGLSLGDNHKHLGSGAWLQKDRGEGRPTIHRIALQRLWPLSVESLLLPFGRKDKARVEGGKDLCKVVKAHPKSTILHRHRPQRLLNLRVCSPFSRPIAPRSRPFLASPRVAEMKEFEVSDLTCFQ